MKKRKQQLGTCITPRDAAPVPGSVAGWLNSSEREGAVLSGVKTFPNNSEEHLPVPAAPGRMAGLSVTKAATKNQEVNRAIPARACRAEARGLLAHNGMIVLRSWKRSRKTV